MSHADLIIRQELGHRLARDPTFSNIAVIGLDPGGMGSDLGRRGSLFFGTFLMKVIMPLSAPIMQWREPNGALRTPSKSGGDVLSAVFDRDIPKGGAYYLNGSEVKEVAKDARDEKKRRELWAYGVKAGGIQGTQTEMKEWQ